jgi:hypothetical protein
MFQTYAIRKINHFNLLDRADAHLPPILKLEDEKKLYRKIKKKKYEEEKTKGLDL